MKLTFTKRKGKYDDLVITHIDGREEAISCPKQRIIPHDMVHYAVETVIRSRGFLSRVAAGEHADSNMSVEDHAEAIERLVESIQAELWSGEVSVDDLISLYRHSCEARDHPSLPVTPGDINKIREKISDLAVVWEGLPENAAIDLHFEPEQTSA